MILSFKNKTTAALFSGLVVKGLPPSIAQRAFDKLRLLMVPSVWRIYGFHLPTVWKNYLAIATANGASESTINGAFVFVLRQATRMMLK